MPMILLLVNQLLVNRVAKIEIQIKLFLENVEKFHNFLKLPFFGLKIRLLFTDLFRIQFRIRIRIRNVYFGSGSDPDPAKSFGSLRIRIRNTAWAFFFELGRPSWWMEVESKCLDPNQQHCFYRFSVCLVLAPVKPALRIHNHWIRNQIQAFWWIWSCNLIQIFDDQKFKKKNNFFYLLAFLCSCASF
jgi:hypothetical protein